MTEGTGPMNDRNPGGQRRILIDRSAVPDLPRDGYAVVIGEEPARFRCFWCVVSVHAEQRDAELRSDCVVLIDGAEHGVGVLALSAPDLVLVDATTGSVLRDNRIQSSDTEIEEWLLSKPGKLPNVRKQWRFVAFDTGDAVEVEARCIQRDGVDLFYLFKNPHGAGWVVAHAPTGLKAATLRTGKLAAAYSRILLELSDDWTRTDSSLTDKWGPEKINHIRCMGEAQSLEALGVERAELLKLERD